MYAAEAFDRYGADAVTVNPYMVSDSMMPFLNQKNKGVIVLCRTSNPGAIHIQDLNCNGKKLFEVVAQKAATEWNKNNNVLLVVGATYPEELLAIRKIVGDMPFLVPGLGTQGGEIKSVLSCGLDSQGLGLIISSSRAVIYASSSDNFASAARQVANEYKNQINFFRTKLSE